MANLVPGAESGLQRKHKGFGFRHLDMGKLCIIPDTDFFIYSYIHLQSLQ